MLASRGAVRGFTTSLLVLAAVLSACEGGPGDEPLRDVQEASSTHPASHPTTPEPTCVTLQRGTFGAVEDALIADDRPNKNFGSSQSLTAGGVGPGSRDALLRFDLSAIPAGARIVSATATLNVLLYDHDGVPVNVHRVTAPWSEATVTFASFSCAFLPNVEASFPSGSPTSTSLRSLVQGWVSGAYPNFGVLLERDRSSLTVFASSEVADTARRPKLEVCFEAPADCATAPDGTPCVGGVCRAGACHEEADFVEGGTFPAGPIPSRVLAGDFDLDGKPDLVVANILSDTVSVLLGNGDGTLQPPLSSPAGGRPSFIAAGDFDLDGKLDLAVTHFTDVVSVLLGNGDGTFRPPVDVGAGPTARSVVVADFNLDGRPDLAVTNDVPAGTVSVLLGNGDGTFQPPIATPTVNESPEMLVTGDFNGDCRPDVALVGLNTRLPDIYDVVVLLGNGDGTLRPAQTLRLGSGTGVADMKVGDFDDDGTLDIVILTSPSNRPGSVVILLGNGDGTFTLQSSTAGFFPTSLDVADVNLDGILDLAFTNESGIVVRLGNGDGTFQPAQTVAAAPSGFVAAVDLDRDGRRDLAVTNFVDSVTVLLNRTP